VLTVFFQFENLAFHVDRDLFRQVAAGERLGHVGDIAHLARQVAGHEVDAIGQIAPRAGRTGNAGLAAQFSLGADLAGDARHLRRE